MRCGLDLPSDAGPFFVNREPPALSLDLELRFPEAGRALRVSTMVDTGCDVEMIASRETARWISGFARPLRRDRIRWGEWIPCDVFQAEARLGRWTSIEVYAPLAEEFEDLLGLPSILRSNICIRGDAGAAFWVDFPASADYSGWMGADRELPTKAVSTSRQRVSRAPRRGRSRLVTAP